MLGAVSHHLVRNVAGESPAVRCVTELGIRAVVLNDLVERLESCELHASPSTSSRRSSADLTAFRIGVGLDTDDQVRPDPSIERAPWTAALSWT
ncbi:hypothetical protein Francci3_1441 [Frankia casuarinae]|uniref:Uncharacterized protein n=1 Tax=Frankia casuarinae (strain DSM 45818 / CECT 9043 / HFP020203 / CcI3) TaxID=106370 RepID=Q2JD24_FRACC|nr:hypothetical protein Francci3_1441 [Frankia casuarinae]